VDNRQHAVPDQDLLIKREEPTDPGHGTRPGDRTLERMLDTGIINLDKPDGYVSHDVASIVKEMFAGTRVTKVGHGGTLDPNATGVLPLALNDATRIQDVLLSGSKEYVGVMHVHGSLDEVVIRNVARPFVGTIHQMPPDRSAIKRVLRERVIEYFDILEISRRDVLFKVGCEAGTYIRTLCVDFGKALGCGAHLVELRRTRSGSFSERDETFATLQDIDDAIRVWLERDDASSLRRLVQPMERAFGAFPRVIVRDGVVDSIARGISVDAGDVVALDRRIQKGDMIAIFTQKGEIIARGKSLQPARQIMEMRSGFVARTVKPYMYPIE
jgi:H/ACA ribonucleoprotein complex subunit 4